jgi:hypothetical protein
MQSQQQSTGSTSKDPQRQSKRQSSDATKHSKRQSQRQSKRKSTANDADKGVAVNIRDFFNKNRPKGLAPKKDYALKHKLPALVVRRAAVPLWRSALAQLAIRCGEDSDMMERFISNVLADFPLARQAFLARWGMLVACGDIGKMHILKAVADFVDRSEVVGELVRAMAARDVATSSAPRSPWHSRLGGDMARLRLFSAQTVSDLDDVALLFSERFIDGKLVKKEKQRVSVVPLEGLDESEEGYDLSEVFNNPSDSTMNNPSESTTTGGNNGDRFRATDAVVELVRSCGSAWIGASRDLATVIGPDATLRYRTQAGLRVLAQCGVLALRLACAVSPAAMGAGVIVCPVTGALTSAIETSLDQWRTQDGLEASKTAFQVLVAVTSNLAAIDQMHPDSPSGRSEYLLDLLLGRVSSSDLCKLMFTTIESCRLNDSRDAAYMRETVHLVLKHVEAFLDYRRLPPSARSSRKSTTAIGNIAAQWDARFQARVKGLSDGDVKLLDAYKAESKAAFDALTYLAEHEPAPASRDSLKVTPRS